MKTTASLSVSGISMTVTMIANIAAMIGHPIAPDVQTQIGTLIGLGISFATVVYGIYTHIHKTKTLVANNAQLSHTISSQAAQIQTQGK